jgi:PIN domain nuclease of toxin-antitoxin system
MAFMLDTHIAVALYQGKTTGLSKHALRAIDQSAIYISPAVLLELEMLFEIKRIKLGGHAIASYLRRELDIALAQEKFSEIANHALRFSFTRDPFDRLIVAHAACCGMGLITQDENVLAHFPQAIS